MQTDYFSVIQYNLDGFQLWLLINIDFSYTYIIIKQVSEKKLTKYQRLPAYGRSLKTGNSILPLSVSLFIEVKLQMPLQYNLNLTLCMLSTLFPIENSM